ncbi:hypothetical protein [Nostoc sp.]|uniref:hypothetical protein n=1 Tax=Nostoc sp. TaxID=1180 RepID=UPI002FF59A32
MKTKSLISFISAFCFSLVVVLGVLFIPGKATSTVNINAQLNKPVLIENLVTKRYVFSDGDPIKGNRGDEGGWLASSGFESPKIVGTDANYYDRALWTIIPIADNFLIENQVTKRYLFSDGDPIKGNQEMREAG